MLLGRGHVWEMQTVKRALLIGLGALALLIASCGDGDVAAPVEETLPKGITIPVGGEGRPQTLADATTGESRVAIWQVSDEDTHVYLLGTVHLMRPGPSWETDRIRAA